MRVRSLAAGIFIVWRLGWMATAIYVPCLAITAATGGRIPLDADCILCSACIVTLYTMLGGIQAVIWNDVMQFCIMFGGLAAAVSIARGVGARRLGEIWASPTRRERRRSSAPIAGSTGGMLAQVQAFFEQPINVIAIMFAMVVGRMAGYTSAIR